MDEQREFEELKQFLMGANYPHDEAEIIAGVVLHGGYRRPPQQSPELVPLDEESVEREIDSSFMSLPMPMPPEKWKIFILKTRSYLAKAICQRFGQPKPPVVSEKDIYRAVIGIGSSTNNVIELLRSKGITVT